MILSLLIIFISLIFSLLLFPLDPEFIVTSHPAGFNDKIKEREKFESDVMDRIELSIKSSTNSSLGAWLLKPKETNNSSIDGGVPLVIMAHGLGAQKDFGLLKYAAKFAKSGIASLAFDYRGFGNSEGLIRNLIWPDNHLEDWKDVIEYVSNHKEKLGGGVKVSSVCLWGSSLAGGHVLFSSTNPSIINNDITGRDIKCVISQAPHMDGIAASKRSMALRGVKGALRMAYAALRFLFLAKFLTKFFM